MGLCCYRRSAIGVPLTMSRKLHPIKAYRIPHAVTLVSPIALVDNVSQTPPLLSSTTLSGFGLCCVS
jgi:hypothetical protein